MSLSKKDEVKEESIKEEYSSCEVPTDEYAPTYYQDPYSYLSCAYNSEFWIYSHLYLTNLWHHILHLI